MTSDGKSDAAMPPGERERLVALAASYQAVACVDAIARRGQAPATEMAPLILSLFHRDDEGADAVYGGTAAVAPGLRRFISVVEDPGARDPVLTRYLISLLVLERKLSRDPDRLARLAAGIAGARRQLDHFDALHPALLGRLADLYQDILSTLSPRVMVQGEPMHLRNPDNAARIRALLLAGVRAARLWRHAGGSRWRMLFGIKGMATRAKALLSALEGSGPGDLGRFPS